MHQCEPRKDALGRLNDREWREALSFSDRSRLTLQLREAAREAMPQWVRERVDEDAAKNLLRLSRIQNTYRDLADSIHSAGADFLALKGITQSALFGGRPDMRVQYDIDLFAPREHLYRARDALLGCGYEPVDAMADFPTDHLPVMIRKTGWEWRGDYFDVEIPLSVDLHFQFWDESVERLDAPGTELFWGRRITRHIGGCDLPVLSPADALGYTALHLLRHLLRGDLSPFHVYEMAGLLESLAGDRAFWSEWRGSHAPALRRLEAVAFELSCEWFGCNLAAEANEEIGQLSAPVSAWFSQFALSPATAAYDSNKDELWLHCALLHSRRDVWSVARRRLLPLNLPPWGGGIHVPAERWTWRKRVGEWFRHLAYLRQRAVRHAAAIPRVAVSGSRWWWRANGLGEQFWLFVSSAVLFNFALFIFVLLYNLYLSSLGFREDALGLVNGANRAGSLAGTIPAAFLAYRLGLRNTLLVAIGVTAAVELMRALLVSPASAAALGFASGSIFSLWAVIFAPVIVGVVEEKRRATALSVFAAVMIAVGIGGNWIGGQLPGWLHGTKRVLVLSAILSAAALWPALRLRLDKAPLETPRRAARGASRIYPRSRFLWRFLAVMAVWNLATGAFNPFANVYFSNLHFSVRQIGNLFSISQIVQTGTVLLAPLVFRRCGIAGGISWMMLATAVGLCGLAAQPASVAAAVVFSAYMSFQWMSEPGMNTLLLGEVKKEERSGAAALNYLVAFGAQALAAFAAGALVVRFGYGAVLAGAAGVAAVAAGLFRTLLGSTRKEASRLSSLPAIEAGNIQE
ncbi:MAG TPA: MFS transporter [Bryobacteraceae bacterium]|nr:MFS transporter [Bryobacteraceae bacterium]